MRSQRFMNLFYNLDILSPKPEFYINGRTHFPNLFGSLFSILTMTIILASIIFFSLNLFDRPINSQIIDKSFSQDFSLDLSDLPIILQVQDSLFKYIEDSENYIKITPALVTQHLIKDSNGLETKDITQQFLELEPCDILKHFPKHNSLFQGISNIHHYYCIKEIPSQGKMHGYYGDDDFTILNFYIQMENIEQLENYRINIKFMENYIDSQDPNEPLKYALRSDVILFTNLFFKRQWMYLNKVIFEIDKGFVFNNVVNYEGFQGENYLETIDFDKIIGIPHTQSALSFLLSPKQTIYRTNYVKVPEILANIGGISNGILYVSQLLVWLFSRRLYSIDLVNSLIIKDKDPYITGVSAPKVTTTLFKNKKTPIGTTVVNPSKNKQNDYDERLLKLSIFQSFFPLQWSWDTNQVQLYQKKIWLAKKYLDIKTILESNCYFYKKKMCIKPQTKLNCDTNITILSQLPLLKKFDEIEFIPGSNPRR